MKEHILRSTLGVCKVIDKELYKPSCSGTQLYKRTKGIDVVYAFIQHIFVDDYDMRLPHHFLVLYKEFVRKEREKEGIELMVL